MNQNRTKCEVIQILMSVFYYELSLFKYLNAVLTLLEVQKEKGNDLIVGDTAYTVIKHTNELQKQINQKIEILYDEFDLTELFFDYRILKDFEYLKKDQFIERINFIYQLTNKCHLSDWKRKQLVEEINQSSFLLRKRKNLIFNFCTAHEENEIE
ncbi:hypothetical protein ACFSO7_04425 [Bacillus sp. CGMCC 1.16607]|uniref:hypothetical protein n=1 Tax=Bacillus sp. CGMCC 1.16607 TaxID=3351842 RepID=UPI003642E59B